MPISQAFTRQHRLLTGPQYQTVFDQPEWKVGLGGYLLLVTRNSQPHPRLGLVIGRKRVKRAVDRARIKRRVREQFRCRQQELAGLDIILLVRGRIENPNPNQVTLDITRLFDKLLATVSYTHLTLPTIYSV